MKKFFVLNLVLLHCVFLHFSFAEKKIIYISPNNDGVQDTLDVPVSVRDARYIASWSLVIQNANGKTIRTIGNKTALPESVNFKSFWKQLGKAKSGVIVPEVVSWNGASDDGKIVDDGLYHYYFTARDDNGNESKTAIYDVIVDATLPTVSIKTQSGLVFGEGEKSEFVIEQSGSKEDEWKAEIRNAKNEVVKNFVFKNDEPRTIKWNGANDAGEPLPDGVYSYAISARDKAGNVSKPASISSIIFSAEKPEAKIFITSSNYFSPETESAQKTIFFDVIVEEPNPKSANKLLSWKIEIVDSQKNVVKTFSGKTHAPRTLSFDGKNENGTLLQNGKYEARISANYLNGYKTKESFSPVFILDREKPHATISLSDDVFGAGEKKSISISNKVSEKDLAPIISFDGAIYKNDNLKNPVKKFSFGNISPETISWNGFNDNERISENGEYVFALHAKDAAGNENTIFSKPFTFDATNADVMMSVNERAFSPNDDGVKEYVTFSPRAKTGNAGLKSFSFAVISANTGERVKTMSGAKLPEQFSWNGRNDAGALCKDGEYKAELSIVLANDSRASVSTENFSLDTIAPYADFSVSHNSFSPVGESAQKNFLVNVQNCSDEKVWNVSVKNEKSEIVRNLQFHGKIMSSGKNEFFWDGKNNSGNISPNGTYSLVVSAIDEAENSFEKIISNARLDSRIPKLYLANRLQGISPNGDDFLETQTFDIVANVFEKDAIASWDFFVCDENGTAIRTLKKNANDAIPKTISWNGMDENGTAGEGKFFAKIFARYKNGFEVSAKSAEFICTATPPILNANTIPKFFSPDNDGNDDELFINLSCKTKAAIDEWSFVIKDPNGNAFWKTNGKSKMSEHIVWDGLSNEQKDASGKAERVQSAVDYPFTFFVKDSLGMKSSVSGIVPIDVLVIRDGNVLKMAVPSIIFRPDHTDFNVESAPGKKDGVTKTQAENNERILKRIAEILNKFKDYRVTISGHANRTTTNEKEETENNPREWGPALIPLSQARAEFVKSYLTKRGVASSRLLTEGKGGTKPVADWKDKNNNWKNRRVEFILQK